MVDFRLTLIEEKFMKTAGKYTRIRVLAPLLLLIIFATSVEIIGRDTAGCHPLKLRGHVSPLRVSWTRQQSSTQCSIFLLIVPYFMLEELFKFKKFIA